MMRRWCQLSLISALASSQALAGTTYYVRKTGDNSNTGLSAAEAWLTIDKAANKAVAGDTIYVGGGIYNEQVTPNHDGTSAIYVKYIADTSGVMTGDSGSVIIQAKNGKTAVTLGSDDYSEWTGFTLIGSNKDVLSLSKSTAVKLTSCDISGGNTGIRVNGGSVTISGCTIHNVGVDGVHITKNGATLATVTMLNTTIATADDDGIDIADNSTVSITGCTISGASDVGITIDGATPTVTISQCLIKTSNHGLRLNDISTVTIVNSIVHANLTDGVHVEKAGATANVISCTIYGNGNEGVRIYSGGTINLKNCIVSGNSHYGVNNSSGTFFLQNNLFYNNASGNSNGISPAPSLLIGDPKFVSAGSDFHLQATSPAINNGADMSSYSSVDYAGGSRPFGTFWDIGCYEYGAAAANPLRIVQWTEVEPN